VVRGPQFEKRRCRGIIFFKNGVLTLHYHVIQDIWQWVNITFYVKLYEITTETFSLLLEAYGKMPELHKALSQNFCGCFEAWNTSYRVVSCGENLFEGENV
jgi:hypothetical protein